MRISIVLPDNMRANKGIGLYTRDKYRVEFKDNHGVVSTIIQRLVAQNAFVSPLVLPSRPDALPYVSVWDFKGLVPPTRVPVLIPELGVLTIEANATDQVLAVIKAAAPSLNIRVERAGIFRRNRARPRVVRKNLWRRLKSCLRPAFSARSWDEATMVDEGMEQYIPPGVSQVKAPAAWDRGFRGAGKRIAVIDTGCSPHADLPSPAAGWNFVEGTSSWMDDSTNGHGTHISGIATGMFNDRGIVGVAPEAELLVAKALNSGAWGNGDDIAAAIKWAQQEKANVINMSFGDSYLPEAVARAIEDAVGAGVVICAAAGNGSAGDYIKPVEWPACHDLCIAVAAVDDNNQRCEFSNCGQELCVSAPGSSIRSTVGSNGYGELTGTSMATPHVAGVVALILSKNPGLTPAEVKQELQRSALPLGDPLYYGAGLVQAPT